MYDASDFRELHRRLRIPEPLSQSSLDALLEYMCAFFVAYCLNGCGNPFFHAARHSWTASILIGQAKWNTARANVFASTN
jgi:hypothetical protein